MRTVNLITAGTLIAAATAAAAAGTVQDAAAGAKYAAPINVTTGTVTIRATATYSDGTSDDRLYRMALDADSDGDGLGDEAWLRVRCDGGAVAAAFEYQVKAPRDVATGQSSGKRMHKPFTIIKEWDRTAAVGAVKLGWDMKEAKGKGSAGITTYDVKPIKSAREKQGSASDASAGKGAADRSVGSKTMGADSWHEITLRDGAPNLCS